MAQTFEPIQTITNTGGAVITFSNIPQTYTDLIFSCRLQWQQQHDCHIGINGDNASVYGYIHTLTSNGPTNAQRNELRATGGFYQNGVWEGQGGELLFHIFDYTNTSTYKSLLSRSGSVGNSVYSLDMIASTYTSTNAISTVSFYKSWGDPPQYTSSVTMYGITYGTES